MTLRSQCRSGAFFNSSDHYNELRILFTLIAIIIIGFSYTIYYLKEQIRTIEANCQSQVYSRISNDVVHIMNYKLNTYDADKTNKPDYALESSGASIVTSRCTKTHLERNIQYSVDGILPVIFTSNSPRVVIQPTMIPGECWSFAGSQGVMVVQLSRTIVPTSFTYEHIRKEIHPDLNIDSAPKKMLILGLRDANDEDGQLLGEYEYDKEGEPLQEFKVQNPSPKLTKFIQWIVQSNHGELQYTCLYRFRVHGTKYE